MNATDPKLIAEVPFADLPDSAEVTGRAVRSGGLDARHEPNADIMVLEFRRQRLGDVRRELEGQAVDRIHITDIRFP